MESNTESLGSLSVVKDIRLWVLFVELVFERMEVEVHSFELKDWFGKRGMLLELGSIIEISNVLLLLVWKIILLFKLRMGQG